MEKTRKCECRKETSEETEKKMKMREITKRKRKINKQINGKESFF